MEHDIRIDLPRFVLFGPNAISKIQNIMDRLKVKNLMIFSGKTKTKEIAKQKLIPYISENIPLQQISLAKNVDLEELATIAKEIKRSEVSHLIGIGGGSTLDYVKVLANLSGSNYITIPTSSSHDGFANPYINFLLNKKISDSNIFSYSPVEPLAIIGDTKLINESPPQFISAGVGDMLSKYVAIKDWEMSNKITGEFLDIYATTFSKMTARMVSDAVFDLGEKFFSEKGVRVLMKAMGSSGVAMSIAGSSRPASGSEHLISHALDLLNEDSKGIAHGFQTGLTTILMMYLHNGDWQSIIKTLKTVKAPITLSDINVDFDIIIEAIKMAPTLRKSRYTILNKKFTIKTLKNALEVTGLI